MKALFAGLLALACTSGMLQAGPEVVTQTTSRTVVVADNPNVLLASPDHPRTWWSNQYDKKSQYLEWSQKEGALNGKVVYALPSYMETWNPVLYDTFKVTFPEVKLDAPNGRLYYVGPHHREVTVGHLAPGVFGNRVELEKGINFSADRNNGHLDAALVKKT